ncbi:MAG: polymer-forming cytoskeletal protein, partial [Gammaproteobacteria bacterium]
MSWPVAFWLSAVLVCVAPFLPALIEWRTRSDAAPLVVLREQDTNIRHFAQSFFDRIQDFFEREGIDPLRPPVPYRGDFRPGEPFQFLGRATRPQWPDAVRRRRIVPELVIATGDLLLEGGYVYEQELYCGGQLYAGSHSTFRAVYAGTDLILADSCTVARWLHSQGHVHIGADCAIYGRVSSTSSITLGAGTRFERLNARQVRFASDNPVDQAAAVPQGARVAWDPPPLRALDGRTLKCEGSLDVPGAVEVDHDLVATAALSLGPDSRVAGKLKAGTRLEIGDGCTIDGALVAQGPLHVGRGCRVDGPVISEQAVVIAAGSVIGAPDAPTTVTAPYVFAEAGCEV